MTMVNDIQTIANLSDMQFRDVVDRDIRRRSTPEEAAALRTTEVATRWHRVLLKMKASIDGQLVAKEAEANANHAEAEQVADVNAINEIEAEFERWKAGAWRFKMGLEECLTEATEIVRTHEGGEIGRLVRDLDQVRDERNAALAEVGGLKERLRAAHAHITVLEGAIASHRDSFPASNEPSDEDEDLWAHVVTSYLKHNS